MKPLYKRILLKLSGEGLMGDKAFGMDDGVIRSLAAQIREVRGLGVEVCLVVGGGNIFRGAKEASKGLGPFGCRPGRHAGYRHERSLFAKRFGKAWN